MTKGTLDGVTRLRRSTAGEWMGEPPRPDRRTRLEPLRVEAFSLGSFAVQNGDVVAVGTLSAILTSATGAATSIVTTVALPVGVRRTTDENLHLDIGPIALDLFGLQVTVSPLVFDITARSGAGHRLGDVAGLIDDPPGLATVLNQILEAL